MSKFLEHYGCSCIICVDDKLEIVIEVGFRQTTLLVFLPKFVYFDRFCLRPREERQTDD